VPEHIKQAVMDISIENPTLGKFLANLAGVLN
jgi:hypothetical protein